MKKSLSYCLLCFIFMLMGCASDQHAFTTQPQKIFNAVNAKYPTEKNTLIFIGAPEGFVAPSLANSAVEDGVDQGKVVAIASALALKTSTVIIAGEDESLTATTLAKALSIGKGKINGSKAIIVGSKSSQKQLASLANANGVALEFISSPN